MEFTVKQADLVRELALLAAVAMKEATVPILGNVLITASGDLLTLAATDLDFALRSSCPAQVKKEGALTLPARRLLDYVKLLPDGDASLKSEKNDWLSIVSGRGRARIAGMAADVFPAAVEPSEAVIELPRAQLAGAIARTSFAISSEQSRFTIDGALLILTGGFLTMVATDGHRLAMVKAKGVDEKEQCKALIPRKAIALLLKLLAAADGEDKDAPIEFGFDENNLFFSVTGRTLMSRKLTGTFPDYERVLPADLPRVGVADRGELAAAIARVAQFSDDRSQMLRVTLASNDGAGEIRLRSSVSEVGESEEGVPADYKGPTVEMGFNADYLLDFLKTETANRVSLLLKDPHSAGELRPAGSDDAAMYRYVVMPMKVGA